MKGTNRKATAVHRTPSWASQRPFHRSARMPNRGMGRESHHKVEGDAPGQLGVAEVETGYEGRQEDGNGRVENVNAAVAEGHGAEIANPDTVQPLAEPGRCGDAHDPGNGTATCRAAEVNMRFSKRAIPVHLSG